ncbi:phosphatase [Arthrobacter phage Atuin]|nr:phosphatase [Arthrobacter phage Atuin]
MKIGIDIGNVIIGGDHEDTTFFTDDFLKTPEVEDAISSIRDLRKAGHEIFLISKCSATVESKTMQWLKFYDFWLRTGLKEFPYFVRHRMDKAPLARALELDLFIDDRDDIIVSMHRLRYAILFKSWEETMQEIAELT